MRCKTAPTATLFFLMLLLGMLSLTLTHTAFAASLGDDDREDFSDSDIDDYVNWLHRHSSSLRRAINRLADDKEDEIAIPILFGLTLKDITPNFGDPRGGGTRTHEGLDMLASLGTPVITPTDAVVIRTGRGSSAGLSVYTANPGGETFVYMHLDDIADIEAGDELDEGELIGFVGDTGNANGVSHLHLEIRDNGATDPYPRIKEEYSLEEKMEFLDEIFNSIQKEDELAEFLLETYTGVFLLAKDTDVKLPREIENGLEDIESSASISGIRGTLTIGDSGGDVVSLQQYLIVLNSGSKAEALGNAGATGYFGQITEAALIEYQKLAGITPSDGVFRGSEESSNTTSFGGVLTDEDSNDTAIFNALNEILTSLTLLTKQVPNVVTDNLSFSDQGSDVSLVQLYLIVNSTGPRVGELSSAGATGYFGPITEAALIEYQQRHGLVATGIYDKETRETMMH